jgi:hypothetical protein
MSPPSDKWKHFERLVAAVHQVADRGSDVRWNELINGRQFDVTIRFRHGLYDYLTVVECKDYKTAVPVQEVEAFIVKSADVHAHHAVMASTSEFQSGAQDVARRHNVTLIQVSDSADVDPSIFGAQWAGDTPVVHIQRIELEYCDGEKKRLPEASNVLTYYAQQVRIQSGSQQHSLEDAIEPHKSYFLNGGTEEYRACVISCAAGARVVGPDDGVVPLKPLARIHVRARLTTARVLTGPTMFEPDLLSPDVIVRNVATGEEKSFNRYDLKPGFNTNFDVGTFYEQLPHRIYYYCDEINGEVARLYLVESFQLGQLFQAEVTVQTQHANYFIPVSNEETIKRLRLRLERLKASQKR